MEFIKNDFPIFKNNPEIVFLDNASSTQKPQYVIDGIKNFLENDYANIHRGAYSLSEKSENLYEKSKEKVRDFIGAQYVSEINYTYNSTYAINLLTLSLKRSGVLTKGDKVLLSIVEHHANVVPWLILKEEIGIEIEYVNINNDFSLDFVDLASKLTQDVKVVSFTYVSNVSGEIFDLEKAGKIIKEKNSEILFAVDASQAVPNFEVDVQKLQCDFLFFTGHKVMAETGIGVFYGRKELLKKLTPGLGGGGAINWVKEQEYSPSGLPFRYEPGTPNIIGAVSLLRSLEYIEKIGGYEVIDKNEKELVKYTLNKIEKFSSELTLLGSKNSESRVGVFSFFINGIHPGDIAEYMAKNNICIRAGHHCAEPFMKYSNILGTFRMSIYIYNTKDDIDKFFNVLEEYLKIKSV